MAHAATGTGTRNLDDTIGADAARSVEGWWAGHHRTAVAGAPTGGRRCPRRDPQRTRCVASAS